MKIFVIGSQSGLGKYLSDNLLSIPINRNNLFKELKTDYQSILICCANYKNKTLDKNNIINFYEDNIKLVEYLTTIPHKKIIYTSSIDIYKNNNNLCDEKDHINTDLLNLYSLGKLIAEEIIKNKSKNYCILRMSALLGPFSNNLINRVLKFDDKTTSLSGNSTFNYINYEDVLNLINILIDNDIMDTINVASNDNISLNKVFRFLNKKIGFGKFYYKTQNISNIKVINFAPIFNKKSIDSIIYFKKKYYEI